MERNRPIAAAFAALHWALLAAAYGRLAEKAYLRFPTDWDFLAYHFPGALATYGLTTYTPEPRLVAVIAGFPPLPRIVEGALVLVTGRFSAAALLNFVGVAALVAGLLWLYGRALSLRWLLTALLAVPLCLIHLTSGYVDLFTACWLVLALAALSELEPGARRSRAGAWLAIGALAAAQLAKFQSWPIAGIVGAAVLWRLFALARADAPSRRALAVQAAVLVLALGAWPVRNLVEFHNPVYPVRFPLAPGLFPNATIDADSGVYNMAPWLAEAPRPLRFVASALEWNRFYSGERFYWSIDASAHGDPARSPHHRLGGWFPWTLAALALGAAAAVRRKRVPRSAQAVFAAAVALVAFLPQNHELRYWLFIPVALAVATARALASERPPRVVGPMLAAGALFVVWSVRPFAIDARLPAALAPRGAREFWAAQAAHPTRGPIRVCDVNPDGIFYAGPTFREYDVVACFSWETSKGGDTAK